MIPQSKSVPLARPPSSSSSRLSPQRRRAVSMPLLPPRPGDPPPDPDSLRRHHALLELLTTELGYLLDLRILVSVYLRLLPILKNRSSLPLPQASSSNPTVYFARPPSQPAPLRTHSHPHLAGSIHTGEHLSALPPRAEKYTTRHLFSASDLDAITRNAEDLLDFHETLVRRLRQTVSPLGISMQSWDGPTDHSYVDVRRAINAVSAVFVEHASGFDLYQSFCSGHSEAFDIVRKVQHRYPSEWGTFELRCAALAAKIRLRDVPEDAVPSSESGREASDSYKRRHSLSALDELSNENVKVHALSASESGHVDSEVSGLRPRLMFMDYMIKPVQRVCRYPLLFDQLQERTVSQKFGDRSNESVFALRSNQNAAKAALRTMRTVASLVDEVRRQQDLFVKSVQIVSRIAQGLLTSTANHTRPSQSASLSTFLSSLAPCYLAGSLDVIHYRGTNMARIGTLKAKYLGAFLFPGGFLVLVKVTKSKAYEPKHWFNLRLFELVDSSVDDVLLPTWFRLSSRAHMFEFAASCRREKDIWVDAIRHAIAEEVPWNEEPPSSFKPDFTASLLENMQFETISPLPTIQSIPELDDVESVLPNSRPPLALNTSQIHLRVEDTTKTDLMDASRRSSVISQSASIPESNTFHLVRSTASAREQVDRGLLDVFSEKCLTARFHAHTHEEDLFEAQRVTHSFARSTSALTMASAMSVAAKNRLTKRESVLVPRKRSFIEGVGSLSDTDGCTNPMISKSVKKRQHSSKLKIVAMSQATTQEGNEGVHEPLDSPSPVSHCSSVSFLTPATSLATSAPLPTSSSKPDGSYSHSELLNTRPKNDCIPKRSKSMIENVRGLFAPRSTSPTPTTALSRKTSTKSSVSTSSLLRWWSRESFRRRVRSAPDVSRGELASSLTTRSLHVEARTQPLLATTNGPYSQPDLHHLYSENTRSSITEFGVDEHPSQKMRPVPPHGPQRRWTASTLSSSRRAEAPTRIRRNFSFLHRFSQSTRDLVDTS